MAGEAMVGQQKRVQVAKYSAQRDTYAASLPSATAATVCRCVAERPRLAGGGRWLVVASSGVLPPPSAETRYSRKHATGIGSEYSDFVILNFEYQSYKFRVTRPDHR